MRSVFRVCEEMQVLRDWLTKNNITWYDNSSNPPGIDNCWVCRTQFWLNHNRWSVIHGFGTYGGYDSFLSKDYSLLELMASPVNEGEPVGYLTGKQVIEYIEEDIKSHGNSK